MSGPVFGRSFGGFDGQPPTKVRAGPSSSLDMALSTIMGNKFPNQTKSKFALDFGDVPFPPMFDRSGPSVNLFNTGGYQNNTQPSTMPIFERSTVTDDIDDNYRHGKEYMLMLKETSDKSQMHLALGDILFTSRSQKKHRFSKHGDTYNIGFGIWKINDMLLTAGTNTVGNPVAKINKGRSAEFGSPKDPSLYARTLDQFLSTYNLAGVLSDQDGSTIEKVHRGNTSRNLMINTDGFVLMPNLWGARVVGSQAELWVVKIDARKLYPTHTNWKGEVVGATPGEDVLQIVPYLYTNYADDATDLNRALMKMSINSVRETGDAPLRYRLGMVEEIKGPAPSHENVLRALQDHNSYKNLLSHSYVRIRLSLSRLDSVN